MIREYCDKCGTEIKLPHTVINEDKEQVDSEERFEVSVSVRVGEDNFNETKDVLCPKCVQGFKVHEEPALQ